MPWSLTGDPAAVNHCGQSALCLNEIYERALDRREALRLLPVGFNAAVDSLERRKPVLSRLALYASLVLSP